MKLNFLKVFSFIFIFLASCDDKKSSPDDYMAFENVSYVKEFPKSLNLNDGKEVDFGIIGVKRIRIVDSMMFLSTNQSTALWKLISLPKNKLLGQFLKTGQGPNDFSMSPNLNYQTEISFKNDTCFAYIYDFYTGKLSELNVTKTLENKTEEMSVLKEDLPKSLLNFSVINIDNNQFFCKEFTQTEQNRYISDNGKRITNSSLDKLNSLHLKEGENFNILSTLVKYNPNKDLLVEAPIGFNFINLYSLQNDDFAKTICIGEEMLSLSKVQKTDHWDRLYSFSDVRVFKDFWGVLYINETNKSYQIDRALPSILLFDWEGNPLLELKLAELATSFDIDLVNKKLYTSDILTDKMMEYDFLEALSFIKK